MGWEHVGIGGTSLRLVGGLGEVRSGDGGGGPPCEHPACKPGAWHPSFICARSPAAPFSASAAAGLEKTARRSRRQTLRAQILPPRGDARPEQGVWPQPTRALIPT